MASSGSTVPGLIMVPMSFTSALSVQECDDWYNNEHVPIRMRLPYFSTGHRYRSVENNASVPTPAGSSSRGGGSGLPKWLATYDIVDMTELTKPRYGRLLDSSVQSRREHQILREVTAWRRYYDLVATYSAPGFTTRERHMRQGDLGQALDGTLIVVGVRLRHDAPEAEKEWNRWYEEDHLPQLQKVPGWLRTRRYRTSVIEDIPPDAVAGCSDIEYLTLNEFAPDAAIGGPEHQKAIQTEHRTDVVARKWRHSYRLHYLQGPATRDLAALDRSKIEEFVSPDGLTRTLSGAWPSIESYVTTRDSMMLRYRLEGNTTNNASPLVVLWTWPHLRWDCWDGLVDTFRQKGDRIQCRILRVQAPVRVQDAELALNHLPTLEFMARDLGDCLRGLMVDEAALLLVQGLAGATTDISRASVARRIIDRANMGETLPQLCTRAIIVVSYSQQDVDEHMKDLQRLVSGSASLDELMEEVPSDSGGEGR